MDAKKYTYRVTWSEEDQEYIGLVAEFPALSWLAKKQGEALTGIVNVVTEVLDEMRKSGETPPQPIALQNFSGKFQVRIPPEHHRKLAIRAAEQGVSLNRLISQKLA